MMMDMVHPWLLVVSAHIHALVTDVGRSVSLPVIAVCVVLAVNLIVCICLVRRNSLLNRVLPNTGGGGTNEEEQEEEKEEDGGAEGETSADPSPANQELERISDNLARSYHDLRRLGDLDAKPLCECQKP